jgi:large subunit ribosomal protein L20|uniref:ribosomal protein L20 n=1 Tax=Prototheca lentecrescens TaxID=2836214 RepID=UPI003003586D
MSRTKRGNVARKRRKQILNATKSFRSTSSNLYRTAQQQIIKAFSYSYVDRKKKKRKFAQIWILRINAAVRKFGVNYSFFQNKLKASQIILNRKICGQLTLQDNNSFNQLIHFIQLQNEQD